MLTLQIMNFTDNENKSSVIFTLKKKQNKNMAD